VKDDLIEIHCAVPTKKAGKKIARHLVKKSLCACVNLLPKMDSFYIYEDAFCEDKEHLLLIKTDKAHFKAVEKAIIKRHPYALPEIIALPVTKVSKEYYEWVKTSLR